MAAQHSMYSRHTHDESNDQQDNWGNQPNVSRSPAHRNDKPTTLPLSGLGRRDIPSSNGGNYPLFK